MPSTDLPPARFIAAVPQFPGMRDYRGVFGLRIKAAGLDQTAAADLAKTAQIDFIFLADRVKPEDTDFGIGGFTGEILFFSGGAFETGGGEIIAANIHDPIKPNLAPNDLIAAIHDGGGLAIAADPAKFKSASDYALADAMEVYDQRAVWDSQSSTGRYWRAIFSGSDSFLSALDVRPDANLAAYDNMTAGARVTMLAGLGGGDDMTVLGAKVATLPQLLLCYTTHLLARERSEAPLIEALKLGHSYVSFDLLGYVGDFSFYAQNGETKTLMGDEVALAPGLKLKAELPASAERVVLLQNGTVVASAENTANIEFTPSAAAAYRVEAYRNGRMWILSNPVYVR